MKNVLRLTLLAMLLIFSSCQKEDVTIDETTQSAEDGIRFITPSIAKAGPGLVNGMLEFPDVATFLSTIETLESQAELYDDNFIKYWNHLNDDDIDAKEDDLNYDPQTPFIEFENGFPGFRSLRNKIESDIVTWLNNSVLDEANDPEDHFIFDDEMRAVLNEDAQVKIGKSLFQMTRFGYVEVTDGNFNTLALVASSDASQLFMQNVNVEGGYYGSSSGNNNQTTTTCRTDIEDGGSHYPASNRRIKVQQKLKGYSAVFGSKIKAKTIHYKKKNGKWKRRRGWITAKVLGESVNVNCVLPATHNKSKNKRRRKVKAKVTSSGLSNNWYKTEQLELNTLHARENVSYIDYYYE
ncbi:hypothetical protein [Winogradskyella pacifica]|uniref:hypothetical protein n=1 Tax=Winogradskyella pacifica TaxID=664642 RepID=UPI0015CC0D8D|nr:hypothetical protein [Winogradskyella pacifica]